MNISLFLAIYRWIAEQKEARGELVSRKYFAYLEVAVRRAGVRNEANSLSAKGLIRGMTEITGLSGDLDGRTRGAASTRVAPHAHVRRPARRGVDACMRVHRSRIDEARRPHDGATRNGVATLSSDGAGRGATWRGVRCGSERAAGGGRESQQRLRRLRRR